jgi:tetratricopeptide (TPR) repeat protein
MPHDADVAQALKDLSARTTLSEGGYDALASGEGSYRDILKNEKEAVSLEQEKRVQQTEDTAEKLIREYETRLKAESANLKLIRSLAELYTQKKQFERALECYDKIKATDAGSSDPGLDSAIAGSPRNAVRRSASSRSRPTIGASRCRATPAAATSTATRR